MASFLKCSSKRFILKLLSISLKKFVMLSTAILNKFLLDSSVFTAAVSASSTAPSACSAFRCTSNASFALSFASSKCTFFFCCAIASMSCSFGTGPWTTSSSSTSASPAAPACSRAVSPSASGAASAPAPPSASSSASFFLLIYSTTISSHI